jgi:hypothetical protein
MSLPGYDDWLGRPYEDTEFPGHIEDAYNEYVDNFMADVRLEYDSGGHDATSFEDFYDHFDHPLEINEWAEKYGDH